MHSHNYFSDYLASISFNSLKVYFLGSASWLKPHIPIALLPRKKCPTMFHWPPGSTSGNAPTARTLFTRKNKAGVYPVAARNGGYSLLGWQEKEELMIQNCWIEVLCRFYR